MTDQHDIAPGKSDAWKWHHGLDEETLRRDSTAPIDQALYERARSEMPDTYPRGYEGNHSWAKGYLAGITRAARISAERQATVPVVPKSVTHWHVVVNGEHGPGFTVYTNSDTTTDCHTFDTWGYHPSDPAAALQSAIDQIGGAE